ncbi:T9SS type A sorting domain-containing protein [candidate division KSB1 bacterium]|nr:T9SS type A sorting domain-containing protein [candidate division KSB1 bacterium]NIR73315.1 T9SS type A sorting domain-containing protein [candidate division KSB1 bacterium]NIS27021.1 T9SS type A sorting domain-containing protein [candidate division KSB1 bacterium]NIU27766.1 T9SS type A sorting domain-containing protein [candidate division KSB1 bacterium]NIU94573.1 T9SS type A sorting domain-containing protein [candidate division KSB1 bacterium]
MNNKWNNFYDGIVTFIDIRNTTNITLKAENNYWFAPNSFQGPGDASPSQSDANPDAGPGGATAKIAAHGLGEEAQTVAQLPKTFDLEQNFPNPFNPSTVIRFKLPEAAQVTLTIYDVLGRRVRTLVSNAAYAAGVHKLTWDGRDDSGNSAASGVYVYRIEITGTRTNQHFSETRKLVFIQ